MCIPIADVSPQWQNIRDNFKVSGFQTHLVYTTDRADVGHLGAVESDAGLSVSEFREDNLLLIAPTDRLWAGREAVKVHDLRGRRFLVPGKGSGTRRTVEQRLKDVGVDLLHTMEIGNTEGVKRAIEAGLGLATVSETVVQPELDLGRLASISLKGVNLKRTFCIALLKNKYVTNTVRTFLRLLNEPAAVPGQRASLV